MKQKADLAIGDLTITYERRAAVDFTSPFMTLGKR
jgi:glutamate receptor, ionotropic, invertebrate